MLNCSLPSYSELFQTTISSVQPHPHPLRSSPSPPLPELAKSLLGLRTENPEPVFHCLAQSKLGYHPHPLLSNPPELPLARPPFTLLMPLPGRQSAMVHSELTGSWFDNTSDLVLARQRLLKERCGDTRSVKIRNRIDESTGKLLPIVPPSPTTQPVQLHSIYLLRNLTRSEQRARVGDAARNVFLLPSEPADLFRTKLKETVVERRRLQRQEEAGKGRLRRAMSTLRALMLKGNKQAEAEYFQRREEEEQANRSTTAEKRSQEEKADFCEDSCQ